MDLYHIIGRSPPEAFGISFASNSSSCTGHTIWVSHTCHMRLTAFNSSSESHPKCRGCHPSTAVVRFLKDLAASLISLAVRSSHTSMLLRSSPALWMSHLSAWEAHSSAHLTACALSCATLDTSFSPAHFSWHFSLMIRKPAASPFATASLNLVHLSRFSFAHRFSSALSSGTKMSSATLACFANSAKSSQCAHTCSNKTLCRARNRSSCTHVSRRSSHLSHHFSPVGAHPLAASCSRLTHHLVAVHRKNFGLPQPRPITNEAGCTSSYASALPTSPDIPHPVIKCTSSLAIPCHSSWKSLRSLCRVDRPVLSSGSSLVFPHFTHKASALRPMRSSVAWCAVPALRPGPGILSKEALWHGLTASMSSFHCHFMHHSTGLCVARPDCTVLPCHSHGARARSTMP